MLYPNLEPTEDSYEEDGEKENEDDQGTADLVHATFDDLYNL